MPTNQAVIDASDNQFIEDLNGNNFIYAKDFYIVLYKKLEKGMNPVEAYQSMGFDTTRLGTDRAYAAARRAKQIASKDGFSIDPSNYEGAVPREMMGELSEAEELAYMKARTLYLESIIELQKKIPSILEEMYTSLKNEN